MKIATAETGYVSLSNVCLLVQHHAVIAFGVGLVSKSKRGVVNLFLGTASVLLSDITASSVCIAVVDICV